MSLDQWFVKGKNPDDFIESMETHKENLLKVYDEFEIPADASFFEELKQRQLKVIVLTEDWCGDAMMNVPILLRIAEKSDMEVRILERDQNLELMDQYLTNGKSRSIPIFIFIDGSGDEVAKWGPRAPKIQTFVDEATSKLPEKEAKDFKEKQQEMFTFITKAYHDNKDFWAEVYRSLKETLSS
ncbi:thioredoxin family protein [Radiobacillus kanasensis]|uniref:thioredoxin family protein n=1 Tax=Radiobacillus kanasensis TaxID=2844358 RepID=UPI001E5D8004|nr:thioredoxin family protein [Radiobacillus kanasensis]UFT98190.1 thioredoxin family protein [Radiobacillus kanasensis]